MDGNRFDSLARSVGRRRSRRDAFQALAAAGLAAAAVKIGLGTEPAEAAQVTAERRFSCAAVGEKCNGKDSNCCSGRCKGKGARKGKKDKRGRRDRRDNSNCVAHDQSTCTADQDTCVSGRVACGRGSNGGCLQSTGNAPFCGEVSRIGNGPPLLTCEDCETDKQCDEKGYGPGAACVVCESKCEAINEKSTACAGPWD
jgi:hypothetical protein